MGKEAELFSYLFLISTIFVAWIKYWKVLGLFYELILISTKFAAVTRYGKGSKIIFWFIFNFYEICSINQVLDRKVLGFFLWINFDFYEICCNNQVWERKQNYFLIFFISTRFVARIKYGKSFEFFYELILISTKFAAITRYGKGSRIIFWFFLFLQDL